MDLVQAWDWFQSFTNLEKNLNAAKRTWRLDRMEALLAARGHPERAGLSLHIAGSKGKGSTAATLASILTVAGRPAGLYTSPHVHDWRERITNNGTPFAEAVYLEAARSLAAFWNAPGGPQANFVEIWGGPPTTFEWLTLAAYEVFRAQGLDAQVLETGLGGRLDATNAQTPSACVLTLIELEHTDILGDTLELIAAEKAGILKPGVGAWVAPQGPEALGVFRRTAAEVGSPLHVFADEVAGLETRLSRQGTRVTVTWADGDGLEADLPLLGRAQGLNAAVAAWTVRGLVNEGILTLAPGLDLPTVLRKGLEAATLPGRMQVLSQDPWVVVDGAHTAESVRLLTQSWAELSGPGGTLVFGAFEGKAIDPMAATLAPWFDRVVVTAPGTFRPSNPPALRQAFLDAPGRRGRVDLAATPAEALGLALADGGPVLVCGSFYLVGEVLTAWSRLTETGEPRSRRP